MGNLDRRQFLKGMAGTAAGTLAASAVLARNLSTEERKPRISQTEFTAPKNLPNIILIMTDQQRADVCKREGFVLDTTPFEDSLAKRGVWFNKAYTSAPACVPARTSMLTGRYPNTTQVRSNHNIIDAVFETDIVDVMKFKGYKTALVGKNHCYLTNKDMDEWKEYGHTGSYDAGSTKEKQAFDAYMNTLSFHLGEKATPFPVELQYPYRIVNDSLQWIDSVKSNPFFLWMSFPEPHEPYQVPKPYYDMFPPEKLPPVLAGKDTIAKKGYVYQKQKELAIMTLGDIDAQMPRIRSNYFGLMRLIDDQIKRFVEKLEEKGLMDNTVIVFVSDHGDYAGEYGLTHKGAGVPEVLMRVPMFWVGKGIHSQANPHSAHVSMTDIFPTVCEIIGVDIPRGVQGRSLWPLLTGKEYPKKEFAAAYGEQGYGGLFFNDSDTLDPKEEGCVRPGIMWDELNTWDQCGSLRMLRKDNWKLEYDMMGKGGLYNLTDDPSEINNLWDDPKCAAVKSEMIAEALKRAIRYQDDIPYPRRRYHFKRDKRNYYDV